MFHTGNLQQCLSSRAHTATRPQVFADKGKRRGRATGPGEKQQQQGTFPLPPIDPVNVQFVVFVRSKNGAVKRWNPLTVTQGNAQATVLAKGLEADFSRETTQATLTKEFARAIYKDKEQVTKMVEQLCKQAPASSGLKFAKEFEFGMSLLDRENPKDSIMLPGKTQPVWLLPAEDAIEPTPVETVAAGAASVIDGLTSGWKSFVDSTKKLPV